MTTKNETWVQNKWRPAMAWVFGIVVIFDFVVAPIAWSTFQTYILQQTNAGTSEIISQQWSPLTLQGGGLFFVAFGTILGVTSYGRTREKLSGVAGSGYPQLMKEERVNDTTI